MDARVTTLRTTGAGSESASLSETVTGPEPQSSNSWQEAQPAKKMAADATNSATATEFSDATANDSSREATDSGGKNYATGEHSFPLL